jgi:hypothetical protein
MVTDGNRETNLVAMVAVKANSVKPIFDRHSISHAKQCRKRLTFQLGRRTTSLVGSTITSLIAFFALVFFF